MLEYSAKSTSISVEVADVDKENPFILSSVEEVESHLRAFIAAFVRPEAQPRWLEFLIQKRSEWNVTPRSPRAIRIYRKAETVLGAFAVDDRYCARIPNAQRTESYYADAFGKTLGVYFATDTPPCKLTAAQADTKFSYDDVSAMLSFEAGRQALFFCHDGGVWKCEKVTPLDKTNRKTIR